MIFKRVLRYDPSNRKLRLFRIVWHRGMVGDGGVSNKLTFALRPALFRFTCTWHEWRLALLGLEIHLARSWGGYFV